MKIAIVHNLPPGGQKRALYEQVKRLSDKHILDLYTLSSTDESFLPLKPSIRKYYTTEFRYPSHFPLTLFAIFGTLNIAYRKMAEMIDKSGYDAVFVSPCFLTQAPYVLRHLKTPSVYYCPEPKREFYEKIPHQANSLSYFLTYPFRLPIKAIDRRNALSAGKIVTNSKYSQTAIRKAYGVEADVNYLGVDADKFMTSEIRKKNRILSVGSLSLHKGYDFIIKSLAYVPQKLRPDFVIVGDGHEMNYLLRLAKSKGVNLIILNRISDGELVKTYNECKAYVSGSLKEPFGLSILEALACGIPVVAVDEGGVGEIINESDMGVLVRRDEKEMGEAIRMIMDRVISKSDKKDNRQWVRRKWNWDKSVSELENNIKSII